MLLQKLNGLCYLAIKMAYIENPKLLRRVPDFFRRRPANLKVHLFPPEPALPDPIHNETKPQSFIRRTVSKENKIAMSPSLYDMSEDEIAKGIEERVSAIIGEMNKEVAALTDELGLSASAKPVVMSLLYRQEPSVEPLETGSAQTVEKNATVIAKIRLHEHIRRKQEANALAAEMQDHITKDLIEISNLEAEQSMGTDSANSSSKDATVEGEVPAPHASSDILQAEREYWDGLEEKDRQ